MFNSSPFRCSNTSIALPVSAKDLSKNAVKTSPTYDSKHAFKTLPARDSNSGFKHSLTCDFKTPSNTWTVLPVSVKKLSKTTVEKSPTRDHKIAVKTSPTFDSKKAFKTSPTGDSKNGFKTSPTRDFKTPSKTLIALPASVKKLSETIVKKSPSCDKKIAVKTSPTREIKTPSFKPKYIEGLKSRLTRVFVSGLPNTGKKLFTIAANAIAPRHIQFFDTPSQAFQARVDIVIVVVDANSVESIRLASEVKCQLEGYLKDRPGFLLVGNKVDTITDNHDGVRTGAALFTTSKHSRFAKWFVASAKNNTNIADIVKYVGRCHAVKRKLIARGILIPSPPRTSDIKTRFDSQNRLNRFYRSPWTPSPVKRSRRKISKARCDHPGASPGSRPAWAPGSSTVRIRLTGRFKEVGEA
eukprot:1390112-Amorphochlora_amoeboformis.AAC.1